MPLLYRFPRNTPTLRTVARSRSRAPIMVNSCAVSVIKIPKAECFLIYTDVVEDLLCKDLSHIWHESCGEIFVMRSYYYICVMRRYLPNVIVCGDDIFAMAIRRYNYKLNNLLALRDRDISRSLFFQKPPRQIETNRIPIFDRVHINNPKK